MADENWGKGAIDPEGRKRPLIERLRASEARYAWSVRTTLSQATHPDHVQPTLSDNAHEVWERTSDCWPGGGLSWKRVNELGSRDEAWACAMTAIALRDDGCDEGQCRSYVQGIADRETLRGCDLILGTLGQDGMSDTSGTNQRDADLEARQRQEQQQADQRHHRQGRGH